MPEYALPLQKRKRKEEPKLEFQAGKVFGPDAAKGEDFNVDLDRDSATYRARKGQGGDSIEARRRRIYGLI